MASPNLHQPSQSRRERPAKPALTRGGIVAAALAILRADGLEKVTMRRVAAALDTGPASLYVYVRDTEDLHAEILDALLASIRPRNLAAGTWRKRLTALLLDYARLLIDYPEIARMAMATHPSGPNYLGLVEAVLALLHEGGVPDREAAWAVDLLLLYATAIATERGAQRTPADAADEFSAVARAIAGADPGRYPRIALLGAELLSGEGARFQWAVDVVLAGVFATASGSNEGTPS